MYSDTLTTLDLSMNHITNEVLASALTLSQNRTAYGEVRRAGYRLSVCLPACIQIPPRGTLVP